MDVIFPFDAVVVGVGVGSEEFDCFPTPAPPSLSLNTKEAHHACIGAKMNYCTLGILSTYPHPLPPFPCVFVEGISDYYAQSPLRLRRVEDARAHPARSQPIFLANQVEYVLG